jgi:hypothetical protein
VRAWLSFLVVTGCGHACPVFTSPAFDIAVTNGATGSDVCDATVTATSSTGTFGLSVLVDDASCSYGTSNSLGAGVYTLTVTAPGFMPAALADVQVTKDDCGFDQTVTRTIVLTAQ